jgi:redox-sensitive bicupin YhaK (pirin superfamily)
MELSIVRIHKASASSARPRAQRCPVIHPDKYLSQCPFIRMNEEVHAPHSVFPFHCHAKAVTVTLVVDGSVERTDRTGTRWRLSRGDADFSLGDGGVMQAETTGEVEAKLVHLWIDLPRALEASTARHQVVRRQDACRASFDDASALLYAGTLGAALGPYTSPWPITVADLSLQAGKRASLPLSSTERSFAYVMSGNIELGRNRVQLDRGTVAWIERTVRPGSRDSLSLNAMKETRLLLFSSPVIAEADSAGDGNSADSLSDSGDGLATGSDRPA